MEVEIKQNLRMLLVNLMTGVYTFLTSKWRTLINAKGALLTH